MDPYGLLSPLIIYWCLVRDRQNVYTQIIFVFSQAGKHESEVCTQQAYHSPISLICSWPQLISTNSWPLLKVIHHGQAVSMQGLLIIENRLWKIKQTTKFSAHIVRQALILCIVGTRLTSFLITPGQTKSWREITHKTLPDTLVCWSILRTQSRWDL